MREILKGVLQVSISGPLLFYVFLNDIFYFVLKSTKANHDKFQALCIGKKTYDNIETFRISDTDIKLAATRESLSSGVCEQHRHRPACASAQSDQRLCYSLFGKYNM